MICQSSHSDTRGSPPTSEKLAASAVRMASRCKNVNAAAVARAAAIPIQSPERCASKAPTSAGVVARSVLRIGSGSSLETVSDENTFARVVACHHCRAGVDVHAYDPRVFGEQRKPISCAARDIEHAPAADEGTGVLVTCDVHRPPR